MLEKFFIHFKLQLGNSSVTIKDKFEQGGYKVQCRNYFKIVDCNILTT